MNTFLIFRYRNRMLIFFLLLLSIFSKRGKILKTKYKYGQYCTPLSQSDCKYFFVLAIINAILKVEKIENNENSENRNAVKTC